MTVRQGYDALRKLMKEGHGDKEMYGKHGASGCSYETSIYGSIAEKADHDDIGPLCELDNGTKYVPVYLD